MRIETEAKLELQRLIRESMLELAWSFMLDLENDVNPFIERRLAVAAWKKKAIVTIESESTELTEKARNAAQFGLRPKDAIHVACAVAAGCQYFVTTDDLIQKKCRQFEAVTVVNPIQLITEVP